MTRGALTSAPPDDTVARRRRLLGLGFMALPVLVIGTFAVAEGIGWEEGWWGHLIQLGVIGGLAALGWFRPRVGGPLLLVAGVALAGWMLLRSTGEGAANLPGVLLLYGPMAIAGGFFISAGARRERSGGPR